MTSGEIYAEALFLKNGRFNNYFGDGRYSGLNLKHKHNRSIKPFEYLFFIKLYN